MEGTIPDRVAGPPIAPGERGEWPVGCAGWLVTERLTFPGRPVITLGSVAQSGSETRSSMLYEMYQAQRDWTAPANAMATFTSRWMDLLPEPWTDNPPMRFFSAMNEMVARSRLHHSRPEFGIGSVTVDGRSIDVHEETVASTPFCSLVRFCQRGSRATASGARRGRLGRPLRQPDAFDHQGAPARPRRLRHRLAQRPGRATRRGRLRTRRLPRPSHRVPAPDRTRCPPLRRVPAVPRRSGRHRGHGRSRRRLHPGQPDPHGRSGRRPSEPDGGQPAGGRSSASLVRRERDHHRAVAVPRPRTSRVPGLPAAGRRS